MESEIDRNVANRDADAQLDVDVRVSGKLASAQVARDAFDFAASARLADAHAAAALGAQAASFGLLEQVALVTVQALLGARELHESGLIRESRRLRGQHELLGAHTLDRALRSV